MSDSLFEGHCEPCESGKGKLEKSRIEEGVEALDGWELVREGDAIARKFSFDNFYKTMGFVNAVAWIANTEDHHPDLEVGYGSCRVVFTTHAADGLTKNDFICAGRVNDLLAVGSGES